MLLPATAWESVPTNCPAQIYLKRVCSTFSHRIGRRLTNPTPHRRLCLVTGLPGQDKTWNESKEQSCRSFFQEVTDPHSPFAFLSPSGLLRQPIWCCPPSSPYTYSHLNMLIWFNKVKILPASLRFFATATLQHPSSDTLILRFSNWCYWEVRYFP